MRVVAGTARGRQLHAPTGDRVRPTADRVKEALFSSLTSSFGTLEGLAILDLFTGSGNLGIEAISRGADRVFFVDNSLESLQFVRKNLQLTGFADKSTIIRADAVAAVRQLTAAAGKFDIIFADPPYADIALTEKLLTAIVSGELLRHVGVMVLESSSKAAITIPEGLALTAKKVYGDTTLIFLETSQP